MTNLNGKTKLTGYIVNKEIMYWDAKENCFKLGNNAADRCSLSKETGLELVRRCPVKVKQVTLYM